MALTAERSSRAVNRAIPANVDWVPFEIDAPQNASRVVIHELLWWPVVL